MPVRKPPSVYEFGTEPNPDDRTYLTYIGGVSGGKVRVNPDWSAVVAADRPAYDTGTPAGGAVPRGAYGYGGGGGGRVDPSKPYINYYTRYLNISPNRKLVNKAVAGKYTMQEFALLVQREDTQRFLRTWKGQEVVSNFRTLWARIFPSMGREPGARALTKFLKQEPAKDYKTTTNPTSMREMYRYLSGTKLFKQIYPEFEQTRFAQRLDFSGYRQEKDNFRNIIRQYTGKLAADEEISYFFRSRITSGDFERNLQTMLTGGEAFEYATGAPVEEEKQKMAVYGRKGSAQTLAKVAAAYQKREGFQKSKQAEYMTQMDRRTQRVTTHATY